MATIISTKTSGVGGLEVTGDATGILQLASNNGTTAVTVDASQNVGIGTSSPTQKLEVNGGGLFKTGTDDYVHLLSDSGAIEIVRSVGDAYIDLKNSTSEDYDARIQSSGTSGILSFSTAGVERGNFDSSGNFKFNSGYGSVATAYGCRAWVNFNGTGTVAIRASGNVTSITDGGTGVYTINFTNAMPDANYNVVTTASHASGVTRSTSCDADNYLTSSVRLTAGYSTSQYDPSVVNASVFR